MFSMYRLCQREIADKVRHPLRLKSEKKKSFVTIIHEGMSKVNRL